jgi:hypothetical protein
MEQVFKPDPENLYRVMELAIKANLRTNQKNIKSKLGTILWTTFRLSEEEFYSVITSYQVKVNSWTHNVVVVNESGTTPTTFWRMESAIKKIADKVGSEQ